MFHYFVFSAFIAISCIDFILLLRFHVLIVLDQWKNFKERLGSKVTNEEIRYWASFRGQTLSRTGNMEYYSHFS